VPSELCAHAAQGWLTLDVYGHPALSELTGQPILESLRLEVDGVDIEPMLPDGIVNEVAGYVIKET
jgi:hypothetical protein